jgi:hypothetical protein
MGLNLVQIVGISFLVANAGLCLLLTFGVFLISQRYRELGIACKRTAQIEQEYLKRKRELAIAAQKEEMKAEA